MWIETKCNAWQLTSVQWRPWPLGTQSIGTWQHIMDVLTVCTVVVNGAVRNIIREGKTHQIEAVIQTGADAGMQSMDRVLVQLIQQGKITYDTAKEYAVDTDELDRLMRG